MKEKKVRRKLKENDSTQTTHTTKEQHLSDVKVKTRTSLSSPPSAANSGSSSLTHATTPCLLRLTGQHSTATLPWARTRIDACGPGLHARSPLTSAHAYRVDGRDVAAELMCLTPLLPHPKLF